MLSSVYISGPMTGIEDHNFPLFNMISQMWRQAGYAVSNPAEKGVIEDWAWEDYLRHDIVEIATHCFAVAVLPGWEESKGACLEVHIAKALNMPLYDAITMEEL